MKTKDVFDELLDSQKIFINDVVSWNNNIAVVYGTYHRYTFRFISIAYLAEDGDRVVRHYIEQSHVKLIGRGYKEK